MGGRIFLTVEGPPGNKLLKKRHKKHVQEGKTKRYCTRQIYRPLAPRSLGGRIFLTTVEGPPGNKLLKKRHKNHVLVQEGKTKRYCTRQINRPFAPRNSGRTHFTYCRSASRQNAVQEKTRQIMYRREKQRGTVRGKFIVLLNREILGGRIFLTLEAPPGKTLFKKRHDKTCTGGKNKEALYTANLSSSSTAKFWVDAFSLL